MEYTVLISSPSDVSHERKVVSDVVKEINETHGRPLGYQLNLWKYEEQAYPSANKPQDLINEIIEPYQIFIGIMWKRFGTPTSVANSGTEEEFNMAYEAWKSKQVKEIMFYFCQNPYNLTNSDEINQLQKVLEFKKKLADTTFIWEYQNKKDFEKKIRKHLCTFMNRKVEESKKAISKAQPEEEMIQYLKENWHKLHSTLQNYLNISYNENRMKGDAGIQTRDLFAAMVTRPTPELHAIMQHIPKDGLPKQLDGDLVSDSYIIKEQPWLSHCISASIKRLGGAVSEGKKITPIDIFVDIARNGSGESVRMLREHQIDAQKIEEIIKKEKLDVMLLEK